MTAPAGAVVSLYVDLVERVELSDIIETRSGRRYGVLAVRVQERGKHAGRQHLRAVVIGGERDELRAWLYAQEDSTIEQAFYLESDQGQPNPSTVYCRRHATQMAERLGRRTGVETYIAAGWGCSDHAERCGIKPCDIGLDSGGLTDYGVRSVLGLEDGDAHAVWCSPFELALVDRALSEDEELRELWAFHVRKARGAAPRVHRIRWYRRERAAGVKQRGRR